MTSEQSCDPLQNEHVLTVQGEEHPPDPSPPGVGRPVHSERAVQAACALQRTPRLKTRAKHGPWRQSRPATLD